MFGFFHLCGSRFCSQALIIERALRSANLRVPETFFSLLEIHCLEDEGL
jgi:hypothetical protein